MSMQIQCRSCRAKIQAEDVNLDRMLAKCRACNAIFDFSNQVDAPPTPSPAKARRDRGEVPMPGKLKVEE